MSAQKEISHSSSMLREYMNKLMNAEFLTKEQLNQLFERYKAGDVDAKNKILECNLRYVVKLAYKYTTDQELILDLISEGNMGMMRALDKYDPTLGFAFLTYADKWIRFYIETFIASNSKPVNIPAQTMRLARKVYKAQEAILATKGSASSAEIAEMIGEEENVVKMMLSINQSSVYMDSCINSDDEAGATFGDFIADESEDPSATSESESTRAWIISKLSELPEQTKNAIIEHFGLEGKDEKTFAEIGRENSLSRERIRQLVTFGLKRLKDMAEGEGIDLMMLTSEK